MSNLVLLMVGRAVNVLIPRQLGIVTDELTGENGEPRTFMSKDSTDGSENALGQSSHLRPPPLPTGKHGPRRCHPFLRLDPNRPGILLHIHTLQLTF